MKHPRPLSLATVVFAAVLSTILTNHDATAQVDEEPGSFSPHVWGIERVAPDPAAMVRFYTGVAGFEVIAPHGGPIGRQLETRSGAVLRSGDVHLVIRRGKATPPSDEEPRVQLNVRVHDPRAAAIAARGLGGTVPEIEPAPFVLGRSVPLRDPAGYGLSFVDLEGRSIPKGNPPRLFNISLRVKDLDESEKAFTNLGFRVFSRDYLPATLPLQKHGAIALVLHGLPSSGDKTPSRLDRTPTSLLLAVQDLGSARQELAKKNVRFSDAHPRLTDVGRSIRVDSPSGSGLRLIERSPARLAFEHLLGLQGEWRCASTKGWRSKVRLHAIARGSALVERDADMNRHPGEEMLTMFHMDGRALLMTHYCVAGSQPRLQAIEPTEILRELRFAFRDATNLPSRDVGHMDACVLKFHGPDRFTAAWSWFEAGTSRPMEEITYTRVRKGVDRPPK